MNKTVKGVRYAPKFHGTIKSGEAFVQPENIRSLEQYLQLQKHIAVRESKSRQAQKNKYESQRISADKVDQPLLVSQLYNR